MSTSRLSIKPLKVLLSAGEQKATEFCSLTQLGKSPLPFRQVAYVTVHPSMALMTLIASKDQAEGLGVANRISSPFPLPMEQIPNGCGSKLARRGKPQVLATIFPLTNCNPRWNSGFFEPQTNCNLLSGTSNATPWAFGSLSVGLNPRLKGPASSQNGLRFFFRGDWDKALCLLLEHESLRPLNFLSG